MNDQNLKRFWRDIDDLGESNEDYHETIQKNIEIIQYYLNFEHLIHLIQSRLMHAVITIDAQIFLEKALEIIIKDTATIMYLKQPDGYYKSKTEKLAQTEMNSNAI